MRRSRAASICSIIPAALAHQPHLFGLLVSDCWFLRFVNGLVRTLRITVLLHAHSSTLQCIVAIVVALQYYCAVDVFDCCTLELMIEQAVHTLVLYSLEYSAVHCLMALLLCCCMHVAIVVAL